MRIYNSLHRNVDVQCAVHCGKKHADVCCTARLCMRVHTGVDDTGVDDDAVAHCL